MLRDFIEKAFTRTEFRRRGRGKKLEKIEVPPSPRFVYAMYFCFLALGILTVLEIVHIMFLGTWNSEIFSVITSLIGAIIGAFVGVKA